MLHVIAMVAGLNSLHRILKDETRRKTIFLLNEKGSLSYTDLMNTLGIANTGKLNYHLKMLNDLLMKTEDGRYTLSEKGTLALRLLQEFEEKKSQSEIDASFPKAFYVVVGLFATFFLSLNFGLFIIGTIDFNQFLTYIVTTVIGVVFLLVAERARVKRAAWLPKRQMLGAKITFIAVGALAGAIICFFGVGLLLVGINVAGVPVRLAGVMTFNAFIAISFSAGAIVGALLGYLFYKKSKYSKIRYYDPFA